MADLSGRIIPIPDSGGLIMIPDCCLLQALYNSKRGPWSNIRGVKVVAGSLGVGVDKNPWFEYGGSDFKNVCQFIASPFTHAPAGAFDCHVWVEDQEGRIYDIITPYLREVASFHGKKFRVKDAMIQGETREALAAMGLHYIIAPGIASDALIAVMGRNHDYGDAAMDRITEAYRTAQRN